ncbi:hypothetical protein ABZ671_01210 [Micromonospora sp. NPDC006766]|uniref:hypothetical protein n=1 Tax=Micromonospora sp. NPDC006766 TaxID=3154778 RepID=UPI00340545E7
MARLTHKPAIRQLQAQLNAEHAGHLCHIGHCPHDTPPPALPAGILALVGFDPSPVPSRDVVLLVRFTRREWGGGWNVVRADNGRTLGWTGKVGPVGEHAGLWSAHVCHSAFRGDGPDDTGDPFDRVDPRLHNGVPGEPFTCKAIDYCDRRGSAAWSIVSHLVWEHAPAAGYPRHRRVEQYRTRPEQHFELDGRCVCGEVVPCPERARLTAEGR